MSTLFEQREVVAKQVSPYVVTALEEFAIEKWGAEFRIYYKNNIEMMSDGNGMFEWIVHPEQGTPISIGSEDFEYPAYKVTLWFDDNSATPTYFMVSGPIAPTVDTEEVSEEALRTALAKVLTEDYPPGKEMSWHHEEKGTLRLK